MKALILTSLLLTSVPSFAIDQFVDLGSLKITPKETSFEVLETGSGTLYEFTYSKKDVWCVSVHSKSEELLAAECIPLDGVDFKPNGQIHYLRINNYFAEVMITDQNSQPVAVARLDRNYIDAQPLAATNLASPGDHRAAVLLLDGKKYRSPWVRAEYFETGDIAAYMDYFDNSGTGFDDRWTVIKSMILNRSGQK